MTRPSLQSPWVTAASLEETRGGEEALQCPPAPQRAVGQPADGSPAA